jgi:hypothetical protein
MSDLIKFDDSLNKFKDFFCGNKEAYGQHSFLPEEKGLTNTKLKGKNWTVKEEVTEKQYESHLKGLTGLGVIPINNENKVKFIVLDIDNYDPIYIKKMVFKIYHNRLPFLPFRSKSGGLHLYIFFKEFIEFAKIKDRIQDFFPALGLKNNIEIFPKQKILKTDKPGETVTGNWINLPYYNKDNPIQYLIDKDFTSVNFLKALHIIEQSSITLDQFLFVIDNLMLQDAPPCLQSIFFSGETNHRNEYLFNIASYLKIKNGENFEFELSEINQQLLSPLENKEIEDTIIKSQKKKEYIYKCNQLPCSENCSKDVCQTRKYGKGTKEVSELSFEDMTQYKSDPPYYEWVINGITLTFFSESDIINQFRFRELCARELHILPAKLKDNVWSKIVNLALKNMIIKEIDIADDLSPGSIFLNNIYDFLENRVPAENINQLLIDRVYKNEETQTYIFRGKYIIDYLYNQKKFNNFKATEIQNRLKKLGGYIDRLYVDKENKSLRVWRIPFKSIEDLKISSIQNIDVNFDNFIEKKGENNETLY